MGLRPDASSIRRLVGQHLTSVGGAATPLILREVVQHGSTGLVVPPGDPGALAAALDRLLDDPELRRRLGEAGRARARQYDASAMGPQVVEIFEGALLSRIER